MRANKHFVQGKENIREQGYYCTVPIFRDLGSLEFRVKHSGKYRGNKDYEDLREMLIRVSVFMRVKAVQSTPEFQFSNLLIFRMQDMLAQTAESSKKFEGNETLLTVSIFFAELLVPEAYYRQDNQPVR